MVLGSLVTGCLRIVMSLVIYYNVNKTFRISSEKPKGNMLNYF